MNSQDELIRHLAAVAERAATIAPGTMRLVREQLGLLEATVSCES